MNEQLRQRALELHREAMKDPHRAGRFDFADALAEAALELTAPRPASPPPPPRPIDLDQRARVLMGERRQSTDVSSPDFRDNYRAALADVARATRDRILVASEPAAASDSAQLDVRAKALMSERGQSADPKAPDFYANFKAALGEVSRRSA